MFSLVCEYGNLEYVHVYVIYRVNQAEYGIRIRESASQEYVNIYSTCRNVSHTHPISSVCLVRGSELQNTDRVNQHVYSQYAPPR